MECTHLEDAVDISPVFVKKLIEENRNLWTCAGYSKPDVEYKESAYQECRSNKSSWMCLKCGTVLCGSNLARHPEDSVLTLSTCPKAKSTNQTTVREISDDLIGSRYVNGHCKAHGESNNHHFVCIDTTLMVFCYKCDDFVINDTENGNVELIRTALQTQIPHRRKRKKRSEEEKLLNCQTPTKLLRSTLSKGNTYNQQRLKTVGIRNLGNTCFMNSILQSLSNLKHFSCYFKELPAIELNGENDGKPKKYYTRSFQPDGLSLVEELRKVLCALWQGSKTAISPDSLFSVVWKVVPRFRGYQQHDAHEFMHYLLDRVHTELLQTTAFTNGADTIVSGIFGGELQSEVTCLKCSTLSKKREAFWDLSLDIPCKLPKSKTASRSRSKSTVKVCHLTDCLQRFTDIEELDESERYMCEKCKKRQPSTKKFWLLQLPNVLCMHLKRFRYSAHLRAKVDTFVRFPIKDLNMNPYVLRESQRQRRMSTKAHLYDLAAVVVHHGSGTGSGHYTAYARHEGAWYNFNDSTVSQINEDSITHCKGYILFYTRQYPDVNIIEKIKDFTKT